MSELRKLRIVNDSPGGNPRHTDVFDAETGEKLRHVYRIEMLFDREQTRVRVDLACEWEYEGPGEVRRLRINADGTTTVLPAEHAVAPEPEAHRWEDDGGAAPTTD